MGLPDDATLMTLEELDQLIAYHDGLSTRYDESLKRLDVVRDQIKAAVREAGKLGGSNSASLSRRWAEAFNEYSRCNCEVEAIAAYVQPLQEEADT